MNLVEQISTIVTFQGIFNLAVIILLSLWAFNEYKKKSGEVDDKIRKSTKDLADTLESSNRRLKEQVLELETGYKTQERRLFRLELENQRKAKLYQAAKSEIDFFERILSIILPSLAKVDDITRRRVEDIMSELREYRTKTQREIMEWDETQAVLSTYFGRAGDEGDSVKPL